ncbi:vitamin K epoxide reductase family protein [Nitriliruptor sp.]|uniref:vitamin K epoxide reductase family protein n=1 Tax=Nitriliruptor sp. TaxID=2448056 RepID=UPI0034A0313A
MLIGGGLAGLLAAFTLTVEKFALVADPTYVPSCSINPVVSCGSVMASAQAEMFGFPNPLLGLIGFTVVVVTGAVMLGGARLPRWYRFGFQAGVTFGVPFVHWLAFQSLYRIGALCPYCLVVWAVTIPVFWYVTLDNLRTWGSARPVRWVRRFHGVILTVWLLAIVVAIAVRFWSSWLLLW